VCEQFFPWAYPCYSVQCVGAGQNHTPVHGIVPDMVLPNCRMIVYGHSRCTVTVLANPDIGLQTVSYFTFSTPLSRVVHLCLNGFNPCIATTVTDELLWLQCGVARVQILVLFDRRSPLSHCWPLCLL
jgi:hypothetical protein